MDVFDISGMMRRGRRLIKTTVVLTTFGILFNEFLVYYLVLWQCNYPVGGGTSPQSTVTAMVLADTHLLGPRNGHWFDKLRREWQMHRAFQTAMTYFQPEAVFFLGDLFDEGQYSTEAQFNVYLRRFKSLFHVDSAVTQVYVMAGNHDIGFHYVATYNPHLDLRFKTALKTKTVQKLIVKNVTFVTINSMAFEGDECAMCQRAVKAVKKLGTSLREQCGESDKTVCNKLAKPILMSHFPLYRVSDSHCDEVDEAPEEEKDVVFREKWDCISEESSEFLLEQLEPRLVLSGHTHNGCTTHHGNVTEWTLTSFRMNGLSESLCLDLTIDLATDESLRAGGLAVLKHVRPSWPCDQIQFKFFTDGITNKLLGAWCGDKKDMVLVRVYGIGTDIIIDRDAEKENMKLLQSIGCGSKLYAEFNNGISYEFIHGEILTQERLHDPLVWPQVALMMARMHNIDTGAKPQLWNRLNHFINTSPDRFKDEAKQLKFAKEYLTKDELRDEVSELQCLLSSSCTPVVFCHNDVLLANVVVQDSKVLFIDMEYGAPNYAAYDIANHFCEFVGCDPVVLDYDKWYPDREFQLDWIDKYLQEFHMLRGQPPPTQKQVVSTYDVVQQFSLCAHLFWSIWAVIQAYNSNIDFQFLDYAILRLKEYKRMKSKLGLEKAVVES